MTTGVYTVVDGVTSASQVYAEDINQFSQVLTGQRDGGALSLLPPLASAAAPSVTKQTGAITGTGYQWGVYWITGTLTGTSFANIVGRTPYGTLTASTSLAAQQGTVSIASLTPPTGAIGWGVVRNKSGGGTWYVVPGSEQFPATPTGSIPTTFVDNAVDSSLTSTGPTTNTTGTTLGLPYISYPVAWTSSGSAPAVNNGTLTGYYTQTLKTVHFWIALTFGSSTSPGTGSYSFSLPVPNSANYGIRSPVGMMVGSAAGTLFIAATTLQGSSGAFYGITNAGGVVNPTTPGTFTTGDLINLSGIYQAA